MKISNNSGISLSLAVWLVHDDYDYSSEENYISATTLMKPIRQIVLPRRVPPEMRTSDVADYIPRAMGNSLHDSIEKSWVKGYQRNLQKLGYPAEVIKRVLINPTDEEAKAFKDPILVYIEQRALRKINGYTVGGKFDMVTEGIVQDQKSTSAYTWVYGGRDDEHALQGSIYRWLNPDKITEDFIRINYIFTDWSGASARQNPKYPQKRVESKDIPLLDITDTENWVINKLNQVSKYINAPEHEIPECTDEELWLSTPSYKYYADPTKTAGRSTKNFDSLAEAKAFQVEKGSKGVVITIPGTPKRCGYCDAFDLCKQKDKYNFG
ncbi:MAG: hypothetical protein WC117_00130 [Sphaerochaetaceae bacterium]